MYQRSVEPKHLSLEKRHESILDHAALRAMRANGGAAFTSVTYHNFTGNDIRIKDRFQMSRIIPDAVDTLSPDVEDFYKNKKIILVEISLNVNRESIAPLLNELETTKNLNYLNKRFYDEVSKMFHNRRGGVINLLFEIPAFMVISSGGLAYIPELDITIEVGLNGNFDLPHPACPLIKHKVDSNRLAQDIIAIDNEASVVAIEAIDNTGFMTVREKYLSIAGTVYRVKIRRDKHSAFHGVRVRRKGSILDGEQIDGLLIQEYTFEEAHAELGLSNTVDEAMCMGDSKERIVRENHEETKRLKDLDTELKEKRLEFEHRKLEAEKEERVANAIRMQEKERLEMEIRRLEQVERDQKHLAHRMAMMRDEARLAETAKTEGLKTVVESTKTWATIAGTLLTVAGVLYKIISTVSKVKPA